jgi:hypothetical protein
MKIPNVMDKQKGMIVKSQIAPEVLYFVPYKGEAKGVPITKFLNDPAKQHIFVQNDVFEKQAIIEGIAYYNGCHNMSTVEGHCGSMIVQGTGKSFSVVAMHYAGGPSKVNAAIPLHKMVKQFEKLALASFL